MKWDGDSICAPAVQVHELRGKTTTTGNSSRIQADPVSSGQVLGQNRRANVTSDPLERTSNSYLQDMSNKHLKNN